jgi:DNA-binding NtrC family response regulator
MGGTEGTLRVLVVDDDEAFREALVSALSALDVSAVATPAEAIWALSKEPYDVMICDLFLGTTASGDDVLEMVRTEFPKVARILITGAGGSIHETPHPAHAVLYKPLDLAALRDLLSWIPQGSPENGG